jgi:hypothetical protein
MMKKREASKGTCRAFARQIAGRGRRVEVIDSFMIVPVLGDIDIWLQ